MSLMLIILFRQWAANALATLTAGRHKMFEPNYVPTGREHPKYLSRMMMANAMELEGRKDYAEYVEELKQIVTNEVKNHLIGPNERNEHLKKSKHRRQNIPHRIRMYLIKNKQPMSRTQMEQFELEAAERDIGKRSRFMTDEEKQLAFE